MSSEQKIVVPPELHGYRADVGLAKILGSTRSKIGELINKGLVSTTNKILKKADILAADEQVTINFLPDKKPLEVIPKDIDNIQIIYIDQDILVVDKPAGIASHASLGWRGDNLLDGIAGLGYSIATSGPPERQGIVQRLDVGTSGLMVLARSEQAYSILKNMFRYRQVDKTYHALVQGFPDPTSGTIEAPIAPHKGDDWKFTVAYPGKPSTTHYEMLEAFRYASLLEVKLETGRTHQIRVHFSALKHPCCGDLVYGADPKLAKKLGLERQWLHATQLCFKHPVTGETLVFNSKYPKDLQNALQFLRELN